MGANIVMPQLGETVSEGKIVSWFKKVGDNIEAGDRLFEVETDKVTIDVEAIDAGTISEIRVGNGATAPIGAIVAVLSGAFDPATEKHALPGGATGAPVLSAFEEVRTARGLFGKAVHDGIRVTPLARRLIAEQGIDLNAVVAHGKTSGLSRISAKDARDYAAQQPSSRAKVKTDALPGSAQAVPEVSTGLAVGPRDEVIAFSAIRRKTAERLAESWRTVPHVYQALEVDFTAIDAVRKVRKDTFRSEHGFALTFLAFITRAVCVVLREFPDVNARTDGACLVRSRDINIGIAVDLDNKGLVVPVLRQADALNVTGIAQGIGRLVQKARTGKLTADDMMDGTYSITNNGAFGTQLTAPIINAPQVAILSTDAIRLRPGMVSTSAGDFIAPRMLGMVGQSFDHRAFDGAYSAAFLSRLRVVLETRNWEQEFA